MNRFLFLFAGLTLTPMCLATRPDLKNLPIGLAPSELGLRVDSGAPKTAPPPPGEIRSLAEWEEAEAVMTLWPNSSLLSGLSKHGDVKLFADTRGDQDWWKNFLSSNGIAQEHFSYFVAPTDSIWIRDYGPWFILDGNRNFGIIDNKYNRPRPLDDVIPIFLSKELNIPYYQPGLVHTGGNYYNDGMGNAFSSTLVFEENPGISQDEVLKRMLDYLGITRYLTSPLAPHATIEHLDTFGKLVSPDTFVFSQFPQGSQFKADSDRMADLIAAAKSPYGTNYKVFRMPMVERPGSNREDYRAFLNSFISNGALYYPTYGNDAKDAAAAKIYQDAMPGYEIVGVDAPDTAWGDSVHCRNRNLLKKDTLFIFPTIQKIPSDEASPTVVDAEVIPSPESHVTGLPQIQWKKEGIAQPNIDMKATHDLYYQASIPAQPKGTHISFFVSASDSKGVTKTAPIRAPQMSIEFQVH